MVDHAVESVVTGLRQHQVLLGQREVVEGAGRHRLSPPTDVEVLVVLAFDQLGQQAHATRRVGLVVHLMRIHRIAQRASDHRALRHTELFEARVGIGCGDAAPVDALDRIVAAGREAVDHLQASGRRQVDPMLAALVDLIAQRHRNDMLLRRGQAGEAGVGRRLARSAPVDVGVEVVGDLALAETSDQLLARCRGVIEELRRLVRGVAASDGLDDHSLLRRRQVLVLCLERRTQAGRDQVLLVAGEVGEQRARGRHEIDVLVDHFALRRAEVGVGRAGQGLGDTAPLGGRNRQRKVHRRSRNPIGFFHRTVVKRRARPCVGLDRLVVEQITQFVRDHHLLCRRQVGKFRRRRRRCDASLGPVDVRVVVVGGQPLQEASDQLGLGANAGLEIDRTVDRLVTGVVGHALGQRGQEMLASRRIGVVEAAVDIDAVAQEGSNLCLARCRQCSERQVVGQ